ncbi:MAG TPA: hypothetical protein VFH76_29475 [Kribbella sp.]|nr:hypothetical protein [Kribbella sp.]
MAEGVPKGSATYAEFARLYEVAAGLQPNAAGRWTGELRASSVLGHFDQLTGTIEVNRTLLRDGLPGVPGSDPRLHARALATVLQRAAQAEMPLDAPGDPNGVRDERSLALNDGIASVRTAEDFSAFVQQLGHPQLAFDPSHRTGASAAANELINQASGVRVDRDELVDRLGQGPVAMQFDQLADAVVQNRLHDVVRADDQQAVRHELIETMLHPAWKELAGRSSEAGRHVAEEIGHALNAKVDEIRRKASRPDQAVTTDGMDRPAGGVERTTGGMEHAAGTRAAGGAEHQSGGEQKSRSDDGAPTVVGDAPAARFLSGVASAHRAAGRKPSLGDGSRNQASGSGAAVHARGPGGLGS